MTNGKHVQVLDNFSTGRRENLAPLVSSDRLEVIEGDIRDPDRVREALAGVDYVFHQAAIVSVQRSMADPVETHKVNVGGTLNVLQAAREVGVKRVVFASSCAVYGDNENLSLREEAQTRPLSSPGRRIAKRSTRSMVYPRSVCAILTSMAHDRALMVTMRRSFRNSLP